MTKLPRYVFRTKYGVYRFKRNIPEHLHLALNQKTFYQVLGKEYGEAMRGYSGALTAFDKLIKITEQETTTRNQVL